MEYRNVLVLEDNADNMQLVKKITLTADGVGTVFCTDCVSDAYQIAMEKEIDLLLVDIILDPKDPGDVSGIRFIEKIRQIPQYQFVPVIIITQLYDQALIAFHELHCYGYVEKPFDKDKLRKLIETALKIPLANKRDKEFYYYRKDGIIFSIECRDILYIETVMRKVHIHIHDEIITTPYRPMQEIMNDLPGSNFIQCHRSTIVNLHHVSSVDRANRIITMKNGDQIDIGRKYLNRILH